MEQQIKDRYHAAILQEAMHRYAIANGQIQLLDGFESFIYAFERDDHAYILRIGHTLRKREALVQGEVDWINYLAAGGISVAQAIPSTSGKFVEAIDDGVGGQFLATAFVKAQGQPPRGRWTPALYTTYGQLLGRMHARTQSYQPAQPAWKRPAWDDPCMEFVERYLPASESVARAKYRALCAHLNTLPKGPTVYGLIHQDAHGGNFFVDEAGTITLFDFDDCVYSWFINDIAIVLFYMITSAAEPAAFTQTFMPHFLRGYQQFQPLEPQWLAEIPHFLKLRELELYAVMHRDFDVNHIDDPWCARFMQGRKARIEQGIPYLGFDFTALASALEQVGK